MVAFFRHPSIRHNETCLLYYGHYAVLIGSRAASFKRPLLSVDVSVCLSATLMLNISEWSDLGACNQ